MPKFELKQEHLKLMKRINFRAEIYLDEEDPFYPTIDIKRPFGNSAHTYDVCEILGWPRDGEDGYSSEQYKDANTLLLELPVAMQIVMENQTFSPGVYEVYEYSSAYYSYIKAKNFQELLAPLNAISALFPNNHTDLKNLTISCMDCTGDDPYAIIEDLEWYMNKHEQSPFLKKAIATFKEFRKNYEQGKILEIEENER